MKDLRSKVAYLRGLSAGLELDSSSKEGRLLSEMLAVVEDMADGLETLAIEHEDLETYVDVLDSDLQELEDEFGGELDRGFAIEGVLAGDTDACGLIPSQAYLSDNYMCPRCGEQVASDAGSLGGGHDSLDGSIAHRVHCTACGNAFCPTEPGTVTYFDREDEIKDSVSPRE